MEQVEKLLFSPLLDTEDEDELSGWQKMTVEYAVNNHSKVINEIRNTARRYRRNIQKADIEDIYDEVLMYLYRSSDYDISKAITRSSTGNIVSLEGYVNSCIKFCVIRFCTNANNEEKRIVDDFVNGEEEGELSLLDTLYNEDDNINIDNLIYDLNTLCRSCEPIRYRFGADLYLVWYVRLLTLQLNIPDKFSAILDVLGINKNDIAKLSNAFNEDFVMVSIAKAVIASGQENAIKIIGNYVHSVTLIRVAVENLK